MNKYGIVNGDILAQAYKTRVEADGGTIVSLDDISDAYEDEIESRLAAIITEPTTTSTTEP